MKHVSFQLLQLTLVVRADTDAASVLLNQEGKST